MFTSIEQVEERAAFTGLENEDLIIFRPGRLALHSLLIRITANVTISDGSHYRDLGINFRAIAEELEKTCVLPLLPRIEQCYAELRTEVEALIAAEIRKISMPAARAEQQPAGGLSRYWPFRRADQKARNNPSVEERESLLLEEWAASADRASNEVEERALRSLVKLMTAISIAHGRLRGDAEILTDMAVGMTMNIVASEAIGRIIEERFVDCAIAAGCRMLPPQARPVVMNVKGASAAGKSTMRPLQKELTTRLGLEWDDFALISPDIWRKYLLDYGALGDAWRYAGTLSGQELKVVDRKLDLYMAMKGRDGRVPHMLIDRFRFDSFAEVDDDKAEGRLLTRFGHEIFMTFMVTPPEMTVDRAWGRGLKVQRYKAVDDLLDHNVEAYTGMPPLFFRWATRRDKRVHYEFLDNGVSEDERPKTIAFGSSGSLCILSMKGLLDIERFRRVDVQARSPAQVYADRDALAPGRNTAFLEQCAARLDHLLFADAEAAMIYAEYSGGRILVLDRELFEKALEDPDTCAGVTRLCPAVGNGRYDVEGDPRPLGDEASFTLGHWGDRPRSRAIDRP